MISIDRSPRRLLRVVLVLVLAGVLSGLIGAVPERPPTPESRRDERARLEKTLRDGNFADAYEGFRRLALDPASDPRQVGQDLHRAIQCLSSLARVHEIDAFLEKVVAVHPENWRLLQSAAQSYMSLQHGGYRIAGEFHRGQHRGGGKVVNAVERDRIRALQLMVRALPLVRAEPAGHEAAAFYTQLAHALLGNHGHHEAWRLQYLSDLSELPDFEDGWGYNHHGGASGAPVDAEGRPIFHSLPESWEGAATDGERWRWALHRAAQVYPAWKDQIRLQFAGFLRNQFGVQTLAEYSHFFARTPQPDRERDRSGTYDLHTLSEDETIARLAVGIRRFALPDEFNFVKIYREILADGAGGYAPSALQALAEIFENRRQYPKAAEHWRRSIDEHGATDWKKKRLEQIVGRWGRFEPNVTQPAGEGAKLDFRFRNGRQVKFEAHRIDHRRLLSDVKRYLKSDPGRLDWQQLDIANIGQRLVHRGERKYIGERVASWTLDVDPLPHHFDRRVTVTTPLQRAGAYLVTAAMDGGNTSKIVVWLSDTVIVKKPLDNGVYYFVADAVSGRPIPNANLELFGYRQEHIRKQRYRVHTQSVEVSTDEKGQAIREASRDDSRYQWIATATTEDGRFAYLGYTSVWRHGYREAEYNQVKAFAITDRPVYRPDQPVKFKFWVRHAQYDKPDTSQFAHQSFRVQVLDPRGEKVFDEQKQADAYGGIDGEYALAADATLGLYQLQIVGRGGTSFRVEEYKKPEFEVTVEAPGEPVELGETVQATIRAQYYFGSPVTDARVKYKVLRTEKTHSWYPYSPWDWLYGPGHWWFGYDYDWYPGWRDWGCRRPLPWWWWNGRSTPPEVVASSETRIGSDGALVVEIDTALAREVHPDQDHAYEIVAEVVDASRRTIVGRGRVLVARRPFKVFTWLDRGYYRAGDTVRASFAARTLDDKPVKGSGRVTLFKIRYDEDDRPVETEVFAEDLDTDDEGRSSLGIKAAEKGQYRVAYRVVDSRGHAIEGGYVFTVIGDGFDGKEFRFNDIELITDRREYRPGETVKLQVNTNRSGAPVLLFVRPSNGVYLPPRMLQLDGKSAVVDLGVAMKDMPNFFVEALTIAGAQVHTEVREIHVPPVTQVLGVEVLPSAGTYKPGEKAKVKIKLTDPRGEPFVGSTVITVYDKAVEYVAGGSNIAAIREFFWKWRRSHSQNTESSLDRHFPHLDLLQATPMANLGVFGATVADEVAGRELKSARRSAYFEDGLRMRTMMLGSPGAPAGAVMEARADAANEEAGAGGDASADLVQPTVRKEFADTALWVAALETGADGVAEVEIDMPENLTTWKVKVWGMGHGTRVGEGEVEVITRKDLIIRLQAPRFFVEKDEVVLSANVHNYLATAKQARVSLELDGGALELIDSPARTVEIAAGGEARVDWRVRVVSEGEAVVRMLALTDEESDAMEVRLPVHVHGMLKMDSFAGAIRPDETIGVVILEVPEERRVEASRLELRYSPTLAGAMVDALPYLVEYPYGCTEQTLNRFLPTVITQKILLDMGLDLASIRDKRTNLNAQEIGDDRERARGWKRYRRNPVFDEDEVRRMVKQGVRDLTEMQLSDGGWGWFSGRGEHSFPHTTAVVVHGMQIAVANDVAVPSEVLERGVAWLERFQSEQLEKLRNEKSRTSANNLDALVFMVLVDAGVANDSMDAMMELLYRDRTDLAVYGKAMFGLALERREEADKLAMVLRNIEQFLVHDEENQTAYLNLPGSYWWYWYGSEFEAHAYYLKLLARTDPRGSTAPRLVKYLLNNRKHSTYWNSTRDTALCVEAMADFLRASGEDRPDMVVEVWLDGEKRQEVAITADNLFTFDNKFVLEGEAVAAGKRQLEIRKRGEGPLYFNAYLTNFTLEDYITRAGLELRVDRKYYKLVAVDKKIKDAGSRGQVVDRRVEKFERLELADLSMLESGDLVEVELEIESKNDYEYLIFEDMKAAGFEAVEVQSGYNGNDLGAYVEFRDNRVSLFVRHLARGRHSVSYRLRAEIPGRFSALPARAYAMYAPELKGNSDEIKLRIED